MREKTYFEVTVEKALRHTEKLRKELICLQDDCANKRGKMALERALTVSRFSERIALIARSLPVYTGHPDAGKLVREGLMEEIPVELGFTREGWFCLRMPMLLPRKEKTSRNYIRGYLYPALERFVREKGWIRYPDCVLIFRHIYDRKRPERYYRDHDNIELNTVVDAVSMFLLVDDTPMRCRHYYCSAAATNEHTEVYIVPKDDFPQWLAMEKDIPDAGVFLYGEMPKTRKKDA